MKKLVLLALLNQTKNGIESCRSLCTKVSQNLENKPVRNEKLVKIAIIGAPNAGKSTFINNLLNHRVSS